MATPGVRTFTSAGHAVAPRFQSTPVKPGEYEFKLDASGAKIGKSDGEGRLPYIGGVKLELLNSSDVEGGKNRSIYKMFFLEESPSTKDGQKMIARQDQIIPFCRSIGVDFSGVKILTGQKLDKSGQLVQVQYLDPAGLKRWLMSQDGAMGKLRSKIEISKDPQYPSKGVVDYFIEAEEGGEQSEATGLEAEDEGQLLNGEEEDAGLPSEGEEFEEELPPARPAQRTAPKHKAPPPKAQAKRR